MDNITHSLIGLALGEAVAVHRKKARLPIWIASALANNLPDLDLAVTSLFQRGRLGYLLHHRGHSHTLLVAPLLGAALLLVLWACWRKKPVPWAEVIFVSLLGGLFHLLADSWNSYGVHPFWPIDNHWIYGDMIFIVEPWIWIAILPALFLACATRWGKGLCLALLAFILGLAWWQPMVPALAASTLTLGALLSFFLQWKIPSAGRRIGAALALVAMLLLSMLALSRSLKTEYGKPGMELALSPFPANPLCWTALRAGFTGEEYRAESFTVAPFPSFFPVAKCPNMISSAITAPLTAAAAAADTRALLHRGEFRAPRAELDRLARDCRANAFLRYARIPFWKKFNGGWIMGDLRFDRDEGLGFGEFYLPPTPVDCPRGVPPWIGRFYPGKVAP